MPILIKYDAPGALAREADRAGQFRTGRELEAEDLRRDSFNLQRRQFGFQQRQAAMDNAYRQQALASQLAEQQRQRDFESKLRSQQMAQQQGQFDRNLAAQQQELAARQQLEREEFQKKYVADRIAAEQEHAYALERDAANNTAYQRRVAATQFGDVVQEGVRQLGTGLRQGATGLVNLLTGDTPAARQEDRQAESRRIASENAIARARQKQLEDQQKAADAARQNQRQYHEQRLRMNEQHVRQIHGQIAAARKGTDATALADLQSQLQAAVAEGQRVRDEAQAWLASTTQPSVVEGSGLGVQAAATTQPSPTTQPVVPVVQPTTAATQQQPILVRSPDDYYALPSGAVYVTPDGKVRRKS